MPCWNTETIKRLLLRNPREAAFLLSRFYWTPKNQAAVEEATSEEAASEEAASEEAASEATSEEAASFSASEEAASDSAATLEAASEEAAVEEAEEPPQAVIPTARARATTATATFLSFISKISLHYKKVFLRRPYRSGLSARLYSSHLRKKIKRILDKTFKNQGDSTNLL
mgnify:CR=1 FL=1